MPKGNKAGSVRGMYKTFEEKVMQKVVKTDGTLNTPCWIWQGRVNAYGYAILSPTRYSRSNSTIAHRHIWEELNGLVPEKHDLDHLCRNRACVNPEHLEPVTRLENILRGALVALRKNPDFCKNGHPWTTENRIKSGNGTACRLCHKEAKQRHAVKQGSLFVGLGTGAAQREKTHCMRGHEFTAENTIIKPKTGFRACRECHNARRRVAKESS